VCYRLRFRFKANFRPREALGHHMRERSPTAWGCQVLTADQQEQEEQKEQVQEEQEEQQQMEEMAKQRTGSDSSCSNSWSFQPWSHSRAAQLESQ